MGCGKTTLGRSLAEIMKRPFFDLDEVIEKKAGITVAEIFKKSGEAVFREMETEVLTELCRSSHPSVVALGGGTVCHEGNLGLVKNCGLLIYIRMPFITLAERLEAAKVERPLLAGLKGEQLLDTIGERFAEREKYYTQAHLTVNGINLGAAQLHRIIQSGRLQGDI